MNALSLYKWGQLKGIMVMGTGDFTHPAWFQELQEKLEPAEDGLFTLKKEYASEIEKEIPALCRSTSRFLLTVEVSNIYSKNGKVRKVHNIICAPSFEVASKINSELSKIGNIAADGRPILGLDSKKLLQITLDASEKCMFIPAHVWTPHFSVFGSNSGFDSIQECFEELTPYITALETGLSSDPMMNWRWSELDNFTLVSNSDAHSPKKLGREANRLNTELNYFAIKDAIKKGDSEHFMETIEFFPEEGKYHFDGHRQCGVVFSPNESAANHDMCPKCGSKLTIGVMHRIDSLADRKDGTVRKNRIPFRYLIPLPEILADVIGMGVSSQRVEQSYFSLLRQLGNEFDILLDIPLADIAQASSPLIAEAISRVRTGNVSIRPGFDGEYGIINIFPEDEKKSVSVPQMSLF